MYTDSNGPYVAILGPGGHYLGHGNYLLWISTPNPTVGPSLNFAWRFVSAPGTAQYYVYNAYGNGYYLGYDSATDLVLIVLPTDSRVAVWHVAGLPDADAYAGPLLGPLGRYC